MDTNFNRHLFPRRCHTLKLCLPFVYTLNDCFDYLLRYPTKPGTGNLNLYSNEWPMFPLKNSWGKHWQSFNVATRLQSGGKTYLRNTKTFWWEGLFENVNYVNILQMPWHNKMRLQWLDVLVVMASAVYFIPYWSLTWNCRCSFSPPPA